jgi:hypothetical protein
MLTAWLVRHTPHLVQLATLPFDRVGHERYFGTLGWSLTREHWWPDTCFKVSFDDIDRYLVAQYAESKSEIAIGLYALTEERATYDFAIPSRNEFDKAFDDILATITPLLPSRPVKGTYRSQFDDHTYCYAYWSFAEAFIALVQHFEGDGDYGHDANLDIFIVPRRGSDHLMFPLDTNALF